MMYQGGGGWSGFSRTNFFLTDLFFFKRCSEQFFFNSDPPSPKMINGRPLNYFVIQNIGQKSELGLKDLQGSVSGHLVSVENS